MNTLGDEGFDELQRYAQGPYQVVGLQGSWQDMVGIVWYDAKLIS